MIRFIILTPLAIVVFLLTMIIEPKWAFDVKCALSGCRHVLLVDGRGRARHGTLFTNEAGNLRVSMGLTNMFDDPARPDGTWEDTGYIGRWILQ